MPDDEERIALFLDYENLAIGARDALGGRAFDLRPVADALAERGRVVVRRAYADWRNFDEDRRMLTRHHVELIEIPQRMGATRKNSADIKMAVDAIELSFERSYITTFVLGTGDSDFTPLVHKLRELNRRVIGFGVEASTSALLPAACDEFLFYERLPGVEPLPPRRPRPTPAIRTITSAAPQIGDVGVPVPPVKTPVRRTRSRAGVAAASAEVALVPNAPDLKETEAQESFAPAASEDSTLAEPRDLATFITQTLAGLERSAGGVVLASMLKRAMLRKDPTFSEATHGFRSFGELLRQLEAGGVIALAEGDAKGDPAVAFPATGGEDAAFAMLAQVVTKLGAKGKAVPLSGLKTQLRKLEPEFSEKRFGYSGFLQFARAATARGIVSMAFDDDSEDYLMTVPG